MKTTTMSERMKGLAALLLSALILLAGVGGLAENGIEADNAAHFAALLNDLLAAHEAPSEDDPRRIEEDLAAIRDVSETDYALGLSIAENWRKLYLDSDYPLYLHDGGQRATALEEAGLGEGDIQAVVVLGFELKDGEMTEELMGRCDAAAAVARSFPEAILVCSGGPTGANNPDGHTEAGLMKAYLVERCGIDAGRVFTDERAMTTVDNAVNTFAILEERAIETMTIVTSAYHQRRGQAIYSAVAALRAGADGYQPMIVANYCLDIQPANERLLDDAGITIRQLGEVLGLPRYRSV